MGQNQNLHSLTKLTEFARDFENQPETLLSRFVNKIQNAYNHSYNTMNEISSSNRISNNANTLNLQSEFYTNSSTSHNTTDNSNIETNSDNTKLKSQMYTNTSHSAISNREYPTQEGRTMVNVLLRIRNLVTAKNTDLLDYKDTDLQRFWMPDCKAKECYDCSQKFTTFKRKHHCRLCGQIFCSKCCNQVVPGKIIKCSGDLKVCNYCSKIIFSYLKTTDDIAKDLNDDLHALQESLSYNLQDNKEQNTERIENSININTNQTHHCSPSLMERKISLGYQEERFAVSHHQPHINLSQDDRKNLLQQSNSLLFLYSEMYKLLPIQNCGQDLVTFLNTNDMFWNRIQAIAILNAMLDAGFIQPIVNDSEQFEFEEHLHYRFVKDINSSKDINQQKNSGSVLASKDIDLKSSLNSPTSFKTSTDGGYNNFNMNTNNNISPINPLKKIIDNHHLIKNYTEENEDDEIHAVATKLLKSYCNHEDQLLTQMLCTYQLDSHWSKVLNPLCCRAANHFKPEYCSNELMDIRHYVNFKKVPGGKTNESSIVGGLVFSKNVAHKDMSSRIVQPQILLLQCPIVYERIGGKFVSISTVLLQEEEYLRNVCARIMSFKPNIILVHKNVAGMAQDMLRQCGITLVLDVKLSVMYRLSRTLQCDILTTIEGNISRPKLGTCDLFYVESFSDGQGAMKTLMFFEKIASPRSYSCLLRGADYKELSKVKKVASFLVYARYNWRLEMSFLLNEFAEALTPKPIIFDSKEITPEENNADMLLSSKYSQDLYDNGNDNCKIKIENVEKTESQLKNISIANMLKEVDNNDITLRKENISKNVCNTTDMSNDFSDPLRSERTRSLEMSTETEKLELAVEHRYDDRFRSTLSSIILSVSPFVTFPLPFLETEQGRKCPLRSLFPAELYYSKLWSNSGNNNNSNLDFGETNENINGNILDSILSEATLNSPHPFLLAKITAPIDSFELQTLLTEFRSFGGRYPKNPKKFQLVKKQMKVQQRKAVRLTTNEEMIIYKDALDIENHQHLSVLFCSFFYNQKGASSFCAPPTLLDMQFYGQHDIMLGQFLHRYCFRLWTDCKRCRLPMLGHIRRYVHSMGCVKVFLNEDNTNCDSNYIYFTAWCSLCNEVSPTVPLSESSKCLSLAKYLELRFYGHAYKKRNHFFSTKKTSFAFNSSTSTTPQLVQKCSHSLHRDYIHQFSYRGVAAKFQYTPIEIWEIRLPTLTIDLHPPFTYNRFEVLEQVKHFSMRGHETYTRIHERIADLVTYEDNTNSSNSMLVNNLKTSLNKDQLNFKQHIEVLQTILTEEKATYYDVNDALLMTKRILAESIERWEPRLHECAQKFNIKQIHEISNNNITLNSNLQQIDAGTVCNEEVIKTDIHESTMVGLNAIVSSTRHEDTQRNNSTVDASGSNEKYISESQHLSICSVPTIISTTTTSSSSTSSGDKKTIKKMLNQLLPSLNPVVFLQSPFPQYEHYTLPLGSFPIIINDQDLSSIIAYSLTCQDYKCALTALNSSNTDHSLQSGQSNHFNSNVNLGENINMSGSGSPHRKRKSLECNIEVLEESYKDSKDKEKDNTNCGINSNNEEERSKNKTNNSHLEITFQDNQTNYSCRIYFAREFDEMRRKTLKPPKFERLSMTIYKDVERSRRKVLEDLDTLGNNRNNILNVLNENNTNNQQRYQNEEFVEQNDETRNIMFKNDEHQSTNSRDDQNSTNVIQNDSIEENRNYFARSLSNSVQWEAKGGKSGSRFCKTLDDRFVLKEMSKSDINIFENFAPNYFEYLRKCQQQNQPTLLAKIFGVFKVTVKKKDFSLEKSLLVMENLFYECDIKNKFDLKGSERNRLVDPLNQQEGDIVLLDENLVQMSWSKPLYIRSHSKMILKDAINRDACFLERNEVMDYSLLVGLDEKKSNLVLGIIDYIRTFTFEKKVESFVKQSGILGGMGKLPTVIPPQPYRQRFADAMDRYFHTVPDRWEGLAKL